MLIACCCNVPLTVSLLLIPGLNKHTCHLAWFLEPFPHYVAISTCGPFTHNRTSFHQLQVCSCNFSSDVCGYQIDVDLDIRDNINLY